jgi:hypothetical protein
VGFCARVGEDLFEALYQEAGLQPCLESRPAMKRTDEYPSIWII